MQERDGLREDLARVREERDRARQDAERATEERAQAREEVERVSGAGEKVREGGAGEDRVWGEEVSYWHPLGEQRGQQL